MFSEYEDTGKGSQHYSDFSTNYSDVESKKIGENDEKLDKQETRINRVEGNRSTLWSFWV